MRATFTVWTLIIVLCASMLALYACGGGKNGSLCVSPQSPTQQAGNEGQTGSPEVPVVDPLVGNEHFTLNLPGTEAPEPSDVVAVLERSRVNASANKGTSALESQIGRVIISANPNGASVPDIAHNYAFNDNGTGSPVWVEAQQNTTSGGSVDEFTVRGSVYDLSLTGYSYAQIGLVDYFCYDYAINISDNAPNSSYMFNQNLYMMMYYDDGLSSGNPAGYYARVCDMNGMASPAVGPLPTGGSGGIAFDFQIRMNPLSNMPVEQWSTPAGTGPYTDHDCGDATLMVWAENSSWIAGSELFSTLFQTYGSDNWGWRTASGPERYDLANGGSALLGQVYSLNSGSEALLEFDAEFYSGTPWEDDRDWWYAEGGNNHNDCSSNLAGPSMPVVSWVYTPAVISPNGDSEPCTDEYGNVYYGHHEGFEALSPYGAQLPGFPYTNASATYPIYENAGPTVSALFDPLTDDGWIYTSMIDGWYVETISPSGNQVWEFPSPTHERCIGISEVNGRLYWIERSTNYLYTLDAVTGNEINSYDLPGMPYWDGSPHSPAIADDGTVYVVGDGILYAFNSDGSYKYERDMGLLVYPAYVSIAPDGVIFVLSDHRFYSLVDTGTNLRMNNGSVPGYTGFPGGAILIWGGTYPASFIAFHETTSGYDIYAPAVNGLGVIKYDDEGNEIWETLFDNVGENIICNFVVDSDGTLYVATTEEKIYAFDADTGANLWPGGLDVGEQVSGMALGREPADTDGRHSLYATLGGGGLVCINDEIITFSLDFTELENCLFDVYSVTNGSYLATDLDTDIVNSFTGFPVGLEFYVEFKTDPTHPTDHLVWPSNPSLGDTVTLTSTGLSCSGDLGTYFTTSTSALGWQMSLIPYAYSRVMCDFEDLSHVSYNLYARETGETVFNNIGGPYDTTGSYAVTTAPYDLDTFVMRHNTEYYTPFSPQSYPIAGSDPSHNGNAEVIYPSTFSDGYIHLTGLYGTGQLKEGQLPGNNNDYTDFVGCGMNGAFPDIDSHDMPVLYLEPDAYTRMEVTPGAGLASDYGFWDVPNATWIIPPVSGFDPTAVVPNTMVLTRGTTFRASDGVNNSGVVSVIAGQLLNGAGPYPPTYPPDDLTWHSVSLSLDGADLYLDVLPLRIWDDPDADNPGEAGTITNTATGWDVDLSFVLQYGANPSITPYTVEIDTDWDGTWDSAPAGCTHTLTGNTYDAPGVYADTVSIDSSVQPVGSYSFALRVTDSDGDTYIYPYDAAHGATPVVLASSTPSPHQWPMFGYNAQHTSQCPYTGPQTNNVAWLFATGGTIFSSPTIAADETVYVGSNDYNLYAINPNGTERWRFTCNGSIISSPAISDTGVIYISSNVRRLYAINTDGTEAWSFDFTPYSLQADVYSPVVGSDGTVYVCQESGGLFAINPDGSLKWRRADINQYMYTQPSPAIGYDGVVYLGDDPGTLHAINPDGSTKWVFPTGMRIESSPAIATDGTIYVGSRDHRLYAINPDGTQKWSYLTGGLVDSTPSIGVDGTIYFGSDDFNLYALNPDGSGKWSFSTGSPINSSPAIGADGTVYFGSEDSCFYAVDSNGTQKWMVGPSGYNRFESSPAIAANGTVYVGNVNGNLYAFHD